MTNRNRNRIALASAFALATAAATDAGAFFQKTTLEGTLGSDVGGVWLAVHHVMPTFRVRLDRDPETVAPFEVGPVSKELAPAMSDSPAGVSIAKFTTEGAGDRYGIFVGDVVTKVNTTPIATEEDFRNALKEVKEWFLVTVRRPALKFSSVRLVKVSYDASQQAAEGSSEIGSEKVDVQIVDAKLPFQDEIDAARAKNSFFVPSKEQVEPLEEGWFKLPEPAKPVYLNGEHRVVAASDFDTSLRQDDNLTKSSFVIVSTLRGNPLAGGGGQNIAIYGFENIGPEKASGTYVESTLATAPFPISIEFTGRFEMTKLAPHSDKDVEFRTAQAQAEAKQNQAEENRTIELAPDVPADLPKETGEPPAVAE